MEGAGQKLRATHFVSLRITNPAFHKRAEDGTWSVIGLLFSSCALAVRAALCADHPALFNGFVPFETLHVSLAVVGIVPAQLERLIQVGVHSYSLFRNRSVTSSSRFSNRNARL